MSEVFDEYISLLSFLSWSFEFKMSEFCVREVWKEIPCSWKSFIERIDLGEQFRSVFNGTYKDLPEELKILIDKCNNLRIMQQLPVYISNHQFVNKTKINLKEKKVHEIERFVPFIETVCAQLGCSCVIDFGCGMGYLCEVLASKFKLIIGIDCAQGHCDKATYRVASKRLSNVKFFALTVEDSDDCWQKFSHLLSTVNGFSVSDKLCFVGLHCCGDLQPLILKLLRRSSEATVALTIGCCYHKMNFNTDHDRFPIHFGESSSLKSKIDCDQQWKLSRYGLRLASQDSVFRWKSKTKDDWIFVRKNVLFRGIVECLSAENISIKKTKRHLVRPAYLENFDTYSAHLLQRAEFSLNGKLLNVAEINTKLNQLYLANVRCEPAVDLFILLQILLQGVVESLLLIDRIEFSKEFCCFVKFVPLFDAIVSPRNMLLISSKENLVLDVFND